MDHGVLAIGFGMRQLVDSHRVARAKEFAEGHPQYGKARVGRWRSVLWRVGWNGGCAVATSVAIVLVIYALAPLAAAVLAWIFIGERVRGYTWLAIAVTVAGVTPDDLVGVL